MPVNYKLYPPNWKEIRAIILERAKHCCEQCGVANYAVGARDKRDEWHDEKSIHHMNSDYGYSLFGEFPKMVKIILTISHTDHDITNNEHSNLHALCQRCHLRHDAKHHAINAGATRQRKRGQLSLLEAHP